MGEAPQQDWLDDDGYPTDAAIASVAAWPHEDLPGLFEFVRSCWWGDAWQNDAGIIHASTYGWSGNEALIAAMRRNVVCWSLTWVSSRRGGHFEFEVPHG